MAFPLILDASNIDAWTAIQRVLYGEPGPPLVLTGPAGSGKTRLLEAAIEDIERRRPPVTVMRCSVQTIADRHTRQLNLARHRRPEIACQPPSRSLPRRSRRQPTWSCSRALTNSPSSKPPETP
jgi:hypothetical protein